MEPVAFAYDPDFDALRRRRAELFESMGALQQALAAPDDDPAAWAEWVEVALVALAADIRAHVAITEGPGGLHSDVIITAPRLTRAVERLVAEHSTITALVDELTASVVRRAPSTEIRAEAAVLLARLTRHRRRGADLVFEAYETDIGGET